MTVQATPNPAAFILALAANVPPEILQQRITRVGDRQNHFALQPCRFGYVLHQYNQRGVNGQLVKMCQPLTGQQCIHGHMVGFSANAKEKLRQNDAIRFGVYGPCWEWAKIHATQQIRRCRRKFMVHRCEYRGCELAAGALSLEHMYWLLYRIFGVRVAVHPYHLRRMVTYLNGTEPSQKRAQEFWDAVTGDDILQT